MFACVRELRFKRLHPDARLPRRSRAHDAGLDLHALVRQTLAAGERTLVRTGLAVEIPAGYAGLIVPRSGLAAHHGITIVNAPGLIDAGYRGELGVILLNTSSEDFEIEPGERIAQLVITPVAMPQPVEADELAPSGDGRGAGGFGSSGR